MGLLLIVVSSLALGIGLYRLFSPPVKPEGGSITDLVTHQTKETSSFAKLRRDGSLTDKLDLFLAKDLKMEARLENMYMLLGNPAKQTPLQMLHTRELTCFIITGILALLVSPIAIIAAPIFFFLPDLVLIKKIEERQREMLGNFPTLVDLSALVIESGLDYMTAFERIIKITDDKTALELEVEKMINEVQLGYSRREALQRLAQRTGLQEIRSFVGLIIQSDELGTSLVDLLRNFSTDMRFRRLNRAEKLAAQASTKMLVPMFIFIFPVVFILMLAPMVADLATGGMPF